MIPVSYLEFLEACSGKLTAQQIGDLNPRAKYFQLDKGYVGLFAKLENGKKLLWISIMVGGMRDMWLLRREIQDARIDEVLGTCHAGGVVEALARYYGSTIEETGEIYSDGDKVMRFKCYPLQTLRLKKSKVKVLQLA